MGKDVSDVIGMAIGNAAREALQNVSSKARKRSGGSLSGLRGVAAGAGLAVLAPLAGKGASKLVTQATGQKGALQDGLKGVGKGVTGAGESAKKGLKGAGGKLTGAGEKLTGESDGDRDGVAGVGKGRRMPVQQDIDIGVPLATVYNQWTQFEDWPRFMHRVQAVSQEDPTHVTFKAKIWGISKEFTAEILEQRPDERIKWRVTDGITHTGVVTFHELGPRLTRVEVNLDVDPGSLIEKAARGMRHVKRAVRADLARFKAYVLMEEDATGEWRGRVEDAKVKRQSSSSRSSNGRRSSGASRSSNGGRSSSASRSSNGSGSSSGSRSSGGSRSSSGSRQTRSRSSSGKRSRGASNGSGKSSSSSSRSASSRSRGSSHR